MRLHSERVVVAFRPKHNNGFGAWRPGTAMQAEILKIKGVLEVSATSDKQYRIVVAFDSVKELKKKLSEVELDLMATLNDRSLQHQP